MKQRWRIERTSCMCGGNWAWLRERPSGAWEMQGCVCHHPWTLALELGLPIECCREVEHLTWVPGHEHETLTCDLPRGHRGRHRAPVDYTGSGYLQWFGTPRGVGLVDDFWTND